MHDSVLLAPRDNNWNWDSFHVGIFEWVTDSSRTRRSTVKVRIKGSFDQVGIDKVKAKAQEVIRALDRGVYNGPVYIVV